MKNKLTKSIIVFAAAVVYVVALAGCSYNDSASEGILPTTSISPPDEAFVIYGRYLKLENGMDMIVQYGTSLNIYPEDKYESSPAWPVIITAAENFPVDFSEFSSHDAVWAVVEPIQAVWPGRTTVYYIGYTEAEVPFVDQDMLDNLSERGYEPAGD